MEAVLNYFETIPSHHRALIIVGGLTFFLAARRHYAFIWQAL
ncbi:hypothetical protein JCM19301_2067 [Jejuia pallidilutea]|uniref:Uncharacterized protein n=1 Tax=Jejuia pallidilutea TaxID=504487 RepID=A0A090VVV0_9FLAO|nr:hypothetical protein JCM19301_2067 [Jejuia pallidilutea]